LQDAASQRAVLALPLAEGDRVLDYCAGGGGKTLAMGARAGLRLVAHDADPGRMADLPARAARAGLRVRLAATDELPGLGPFDLVLVDAPCSGSGTWRRAPEAKWRLTPEALAALTRRQDAILAAAAALVRPGGHLAYATCSVLSEENGDRIAAFCAGHPGWQVAGGLELLPGPLQDGFYLRFMKSPQGATRGCDLPREHA
jgi:16S rRNA (cytosine967-C5)-methyltransferase